MESAAYQGQDLVLRLPLTAALPRIVVCGLLVENVGQ